jgi:uncharacterized protein (DUF1499 family)
MDVAKIQIEAIKNHFKESDTYSIKYFINDQTVYFAVDNSMIVLFSRSDLVLQPKEGSKDFDNKDYASFKPCKNVVDNVLKLDSEPAEITQDIRKVKSVGDCVWIVSKNHKTLVSLKKLKLFGALDDLRAEISSETNPIVIKTSDNMLLGVVCPVRQQ